MGPAEETATKNVVNLAEQLRQWLKDHYGHAPDIKDAARDFDLSLASLRRDYPDTP